MNIHIFNTLHKNNVSNILIINEDMQLLGISLAFKQYFGANYTAEIADLNVLFSAEIIEKIARMKLICDKRGTSIELEVKPFQDVEIVFDIIMQKVPYQYGFSYQMEWKEYVSKRSDTNEILLAENKLLRDNQKELIALNQTLSDKLAAQQTLITQLSLQNNVHNRAEQDDFASISAEKIKSKNELLESQKRLQLALDAGNLGIWDWDIETNEVVYNKRWIEMLGYEVSEISPNVDAFFALVHPEDAILMNELVQKNLKNEIPYFEIELRLKGKDGEYHWIYDRGMVVSRDETGKPLRAAGIHVYINDQKQASAALVKSEQKFRNIFHFNSIGIVLSDKKGTIIDANPKIMELLGYNLAELRNLRPIDFSHPDDLQQERILSREMIEQGKDYFQMEKRYIRKDKKIIWINFSLTIIRGADKQLQMAIALMEDITEKKLQEEKLKEQNATLIKINEELNHFVYRTSHDLRAPLTSLMGLVQITEIANNEAERNKYLGMMTRQLHYLDGVIKEIIDYRKVSAGEVSISEISLAENIHNVMLHYQFLPNYALIQQSVEIEQDVPFYSDEVKINIILNNLISNAIKYSDKLKENPFLKINVQVDTEKAVITLKDNGIGIAEEHLPSIFNMFFRATVQQNGTGLGLYIVNEALSKLKANIAVSSKIHEGSCFVLTIPNTNPVRV